MNELQGTIDRFVYCNQENGYAVCLLQLDNKEHVTLNGYIGHLKAGELLSVQGIWQNHPKFGRQFIVQKYTVHPLTSIPGLKKYLASGVIKGIGSSYAQKLVDFFGTHVLEVIDKSPERLSSVPGIGQKRVEQIIAGWKSQKEISHIMVFLQDKGISPTYAMKIYKTYGAKACDIVAQQPYRLAQDVWGIGFLIADTIAQKIGIAFDDIHRIEAGIIHTLTEGTKQGHLYSDLSSLRKKSCDLLSLSPEHDAQLSAALRSLHGTQKIIVIAYESNHFIALASCYHTEKSLAWRMKESISCAAARTITADDIASFFAKDTGLPVVNDDQKSAIMAALCNTITVVTGGPGTGKTTIIKKIIALCDAHSLHCKLAAPTGRAAKRITESTGRPATTIHRLLEFDVSTMGFARHDKNPLDCDVLIIDETSMLDVFLAYAIIKAMRLGSRIIFIGDSDQLPSVGAGNFLHDCIMSNTIACVKLTHIFRQAHNSMIIVNAHRINRGQFPTMKLHEGAQRDFIYITEDNPDLCFSHIETIFRDALPRLNATACDAIVLTPMHRGSTGSQELNIKLQSLLNGEQEQKIVYRGTVFKPNDRVMQLKNNYEKLVFNGDIGVITAIDGDDISVSFDGRLVTYDIAECDELVLAYAISIHKSQGSEFDVVIIPLFMQHYMLLQKNLLYTAVTRAKKMCILIGQSKAISIALQNKNAGQRTTFLKDFLQKQSSVICL